MTLFLAGLVIFVIGLLVGAYLVLGAVADCRALRNIRREYPWALGKFGRAVQRLAGGYRP